MTAVHPIRIRHRREFTVVANQLAQDNRLSLRARGLFLYLYSLPDGWDTSTLAISQVVPEGRDAVRTAARELEDLGYLIRRRMHTERGHWVTEWWLGDQPTFVDEPPGTDFQATVNQAPVLQASIERTQDKELPPIPPTPSVGGCAAHRERRANCRSCGTSPRVRAQAERAARRHPAAGKPCPEHLGERDNLGVCRSCAADLLVR